MCLFNNCGCNSNVVTARNNCCNQNCANVGSNLSNFSNCNNCRCRAFENAVVNAAAERITGCGCSRNSGHCRCCCSGNCSDMRCRAFENAVINAAVERITGCGCSRNSCNSCDSRFGSSVFSDSCSCNCSGNCSDTRCRAFENAVINAAAERITGCGCSRNNGNSSCNCRSGNSCNRQSRCASNESDFYYARQYGLFNDCGCCE